MPARPRLLAVAACLSLVALLASAGCEPSPDAQRQVRMRTNNMARTASVYAGSEASRPGKLQRAGDYISMSVQRDVARVPRAGGYIEDWWNRDCKRVQERQPVYLDEAGRILWGKPETIEHNAIIMFF